MSRPDNQGEKTNDELNARRIKRTVSANSSIDILSSIEKKKQIFSLSDIDSSDVESYDDQDDIENQQEIQLESSKETQMINLKDTVLSTSNSRPRNSIFHSKSMDSFYAIAKKKMKANNSQSLHTFNFDHLNKINNNDLSNLKNLYENLKDRYVVEKQKTIEIETEVEVLKDEVKKLQKLVANKDMQIEELISYGESTINSCNDMIGDLNKNLQELKITNYNLNLSCQSHIEQLKHQENELIEKDEKLDDYSLRISEMIEDKRHLERCLTDANEKILAQHQEIITLSENKTFLVNEIAQLLQKDDECIDDSSSCYQSENELLNQIKQLIDSKDKKITEYIQYQVDLVNEIVKLNERIKLLEYDLNDDSNSRIDEKNIIDENEKEDEKISTKKKVTVGRCKVPGCDGTGNTNPKISSHRTTKACPNNPENNRKIRNSINNLRATPNVGIKSFEEYLQRRINEALSVSSKEINELNEIIISKAFENETLQNELNVANDNYNKLNLESQNLNKIVKKMIEDHDNEKEFLINNQKELEEYQIKLEDENNILNEKIEKLITELNLKKMEIIQLYHQIEDLKREAKKYDEKLILHKKENKLETKSIENAKPKSNISSEKPLNESLESIKKEASSIQNTTIFHERALLHAQITDSKKAIEKRSSV